MEKHLVNRCRLVFSENSLGLFGHRSIEMITCVWLTVPKLTYFLSSWIKSQRNSDFPKFQPFRFQEHRSVQEVEVS